MFSFLFPLSVEELSERGWVSIQISLDQAKPEKTVNTDEIIAAYREKQICIVKKN